MAEEMVAQVGDVEPAVKLGPSTSAMKNVYLHKGPIRVPVEGSSSSARK